MPRPTRVLICTLVLDPMWVPIMIFSFGFTSIVIEAVV